MKTVASQAANRRVANPIGRVHSLKKPRIWLENPQRRAERAQRKREFEQSLSEANDAGHSNVMEFIHRVMKESIAGTAKDKELHLQKLGMYNGMAEQLSEYLDELVKETTKTAEESGSKSKKGTTCSASGAILKARQLERLAAQAERIARHSESETWEDINIAEITALLRHAREMFAIAAQSLSRTAAQDVKRHSTR